MGWASGSSLMSEIIDILQEELPKDKQKRKDILRSIYSAFEDHDCDTLDECTGIDEAFDEVYREIILEKNGYDPFEEDDEEELIIEWEPEDDEDC